MLWENNTHIQVIAKIKETLEYMRVPELSKQLTPRHALGHLLNARHVPLILATMVKRRDLMKDSGAAHEFYPSNNETQYNPLANQQH